MLKAIDKQKKVYLSYGKDQINKKETYFCPHCKEKVIFVDAVFKIKHFRHKARSNCEYEPESKIHIEMKKEICEFLNLNPINALEINLGFAIPDIYIKEERIAIECQASQISTKKFVERTLNYHKNNISVLWIWDYKLWEKNKGVRLLNKIVRKMYFNRIYFYDSEEFFSLQFPYPKQKKVKIYKPKLITTNGSFPEFLDDTFDLSDLNKREMEYIGGAAKFYEVKIARFFDKYNG